MSPTPSWQLEKINNELSDLFHSSPLGTGPHLFHFQKTKTLDETENRGREPKF
jgi:hypothetical protein